MAQRGRNPPPQDIALSLLERPTEPVFMPKGDKNIVWQVPDSYIDEKYKGMETMLKTRFGVGETTPVTVRPVTMSIDIPTLQELPRRSNFSPHIPYHRKLAARLVTSFMAMKDTDDFFSACAFCRDRINPSLFVYAMSVAMLHRPDTRNLRIPPLTEIFPDKFVDGGLFHQAREQATLVAEASMRIPLEIPMNYSATDLELEHRMAYWREDLGLNLHHWHWHLVYPGDGPREIVGKDRRGELFYYSHQQIVARYDLERISNQMPRVKRLMNFNEPLEEGYFPKLDSLVASRSYAPRHSGAMLKDVDRESDQLRFDLQDLVRWRERIFEAIHRGRVDLPNGTSRPLDIDQLGNMLEANVLSPNGLLYGDLHDFMHMVIAFCHDPDQRHLETFGVIGDPATGMRDPLFYRLHAFVNDVFLEFTNTLPRYTIPQLEYQGIRVTSVEVVTPNAARNTVETFWQKSTVDMSRGLDFAPRGAVLARFTHLQHAPFQYRINVENSTNGPRMGTVRIFLAPKFDERGQPWQFVDQKNLFIELDKFVVNLKNNPRVTTISRNSSDSTVTIPFEQTFRDLEANRPAGGDALNQFNFCGCGWPENLLVPKGNPGGLVCQLFVMVSNYADDQVDERRSTTSCRDAASYCGLRDALYPDKRPMGYPFDRLPRSEVQTIAQFLTPNMLLTDVTIHFTDRVFDSQATRG